MKRKRPVRDYSPQCEEFFPFTNSPLRFDSPIRKEVSSSNSRPRLRRDNFHHGGKGIDSSVHRILRITSGIQEKRKPAQQCKTNGRAHKAGLGIPFELVVITCGGGEQQGQQGQAN